MAISGISQAFAAVGAYDSQAQAGDAQNNPRAALQPKEAAAQTRLSAFGQVKSSLAELQSHAQALSTISPSTTPGDLKTRVQGFVQSFNNLNATVSTITSQKLTALTGDARPAQALNEIRKAVAGTNDASIAALQKLGIEHQKDGTFSVNQKTLDQSFQTNPAGTSSALASAAVRVENAANQQLSVRASAGTKIQDSSAPLNTVASTRSSDQAQQDKQMQMDKQKIQQQFLAAQLANAGGYAARNAVTTYFNVATL